MTIRSSAPSIATGTLIGSLTRRLIASSMLPAWRVENVVCPVFIAWKSVWASRPRTSPTMMNSGRWRSAALRRANMSTSPFEPLTLISRVWVGSQFSCGSWISRVSSMETIFAWWGMKNEIAFIVEVLPLAVPPTTIMLLRFSTASQMHASTSGL